MMQNEDTVALQSGSSTYDKVSAVVSVLMHPFLLPLYAVSLLLYGRTVMAFIPLKMKLFFTLVVVMNTLVIPALCVGLLRSTGYIKDLRLDNRRDRMIPLLITVACYGICAFMVSDIFVAFLIRKFLLAGGACVLFALIITYFWKISLHMVAAGGALAMLILINVSGLGNMLIPVVAMIFMTGLLASARLQLGAHDPWQVAAGFAGGFSTAALVILV